METASSSSARVRVVLAEDHTIVREGLRALLSGCDDVEVVGEAADGEEALNVTTALRPEVVVMDLGLPRVHGVDAIRELRRRLPEVRVVVLSMHSTEDYVRPALRAGASGYLVKGSGLSDLVKAIRLVSQGGTFLDRGLAELVFAEPAAGSAENELTSRESEVLQRVADGESSAEIAKALSVSVKTVESHRSRTMAKLGVANAAALVREAIRRGLVRMKD
jgi:two-component system, NarL family, response regulator NreC